MAAGLCVERIVLIPSFASLLYPLALASALTRDGGAEGSRGKSWQLFPFRDRWIKGLLSPTIPQYDCALIQMNKKPWRNTVICLVVAALLCVLVTEFMSELLGVAWHIRHGRMAHLNGPRGNKYDVTIPALFYPLVDEGGWNLSVIRKAGRVRGFLGHREFAIMSVSVSPLRSTTDELRQTAPLLKDRLGVATNEVASFSVAGQELHCFERTEERGELAGITRSLDATQLECVPLSSQAGFSASFTGSRSLVPTFYSLLHGVKQSKG